MLDWGNRLHTAMAIPPAPMEHAPESLPMRLARPLIERIVRRSRSRGSAVTPSQTRSDTPYAGLVAAFGASPIGPALARTFDSMWASTVLSRRCKLLMFGVISRGLPCELCELEVAHALQKEGLDAGTTTRLLSHLDGPELEPVERLLMAYARETLWYQPATLQRHTRALRDQLSTEQLVEAVGVIALANGVCRMAAVVMAEPDA